MNDECLTHFDDEGKAIMVEVGDKAPTKGSPWPRGEVRMQETTLQRILDRGWKRGMSSAWRGWPGSWRPSRPRT